MPTLTCNKQSRLLRPDPRVKSEVQQRTGAGCPGSAIAPKGDIVSSPTCAPLTFGKPRRILPIKGCRGYNRPRFTPFNFVARRFS